MTEMEMKVLAHQASLTPEQHRDNELKSNQKDLPPLQVTHIGPEDVEKMAMLFGKPQQAPQEGLVQGWQDPMQRHQQVKKVEIKHDDI